MKSKRTVVNKFIIFLILALIICIGFVLYKSYKKQMEIQEKEPIKVACVGDSLTFRRPYAGEKIHNYSEYLSNILGDEYKVKNFGEAGACVRSDGNFPYKSLRVYRASVEYEAEILIIMIGTNDIWDYNWKDAEVFKSEYVALIDSYLQSENNPQIYLCTLPKIFDENGMTVETGCGERLEILSSVIREVANERGYKLIEMNQITAQHPEWYSDDHIHFSNDGVREIAKIIEEELLGAN